MLKNIILLIGIILSSLFYVIGTYYFRFEKHHSNNFTKILLISLLFGMCSYFIKIPIFHFFGKNHEIAFINIIFLVFTFIFLNLYSKYILHESIKTHTYIIICLIIGLILLNDILNYYM
jgi:uncharacterized protein (DUF486 family)